MQKADGKQPSALKICVAVSKEKGFSKELRRSHEKSNKKAKNQANMWSTENSRFLWKTYRKTAENKSKKLVFACFLVEVTGKRGINS